MNFKKQIEKDPILKMAFEEFKKNQLKYFHPNKKIQIFIRKKLKEDSNEK